MISEKSNIVPSEFIIVGGTGNLSKNKILPALFWRFIDKQIDENSNIILCDKEIKSKDRTNLASIIELLHTATLVHDDVVDESEIRRGTR